MYIFLIDNTSGNSAIDKRIKEFGSLGGIGITALTALNELGLPEEAWEGPFLDETLYIYKGKKRYYIIFPPTNLAAPVWQHIQSLGTFVEGRPPQDLAKKFSRRLEIKVEDGRIVFHHQAPYDAPHELTARDLGFMWLLFQSGPGILSIVTTVIVLIIVRKVRLYKLSLAFIAASLLVIVIPACWNIIVNPSGEIKGFATAHDITNERGPVSWRLCRWGIVEGDHVTVNRIYLHRATGVPFDEAMYFDGDNPTPVMLAAWLLFLAVMSKVVLVEGLQTIKDRAQSVSARAVEIVSSSIAGSRGLWHVVPIAAQSERSGSNQEKKANRTWFPKCLFSSKKALIIFGVIWMLIIALLGIYLMSNPLTWNETCRKCSDPVYAQGLCSKHYWMNH